VWYDITVRRTDRVAGCVPGGGRGRAWFTGSPGANLLSATASLSTKPEVHNVLHCRLRSTEPRPQLICIENFVKFGTWFLDMRADRHRQTDRHDDTADTLHLYRGRIKHDFYLSGHCNITAGCRRLYRLCLIHNCHSPIDVHPINENNSWTYVVQFEVESAGIADRVAVTVTSPQRRRCRQAVSTLQTSTTSAHLPQPLN